MSLPIGTLLLVASVLTSGTSSGRPRGPRLANVKVRNVEREGRIRLVPTRNAGPSAIRRYVKLPIPNDEAYELAHALLFGMKFFWKRKRGELMDYHIFSEPFVSIPGSVGFNATHYLYSIIDRKLKDPIKIKEKEHYMGACRVSPIQDPDQVYVHLQPAYVDTISYMIHLGFKAGKWSKRLKTVQDIKLGEIYIFTDGRKNYRVQLLKRNVIEEQEEVPSVGESDDRKSKETGSGSEGSSDEDPYAIEPTVLDDVPFDSKHEEEKVMVFRIDYGGRPITISRADLYDAGDIWPRPENLPPLKEIPPLAFPVNVKYVQRSPENINARVEELRTQQRIVKIETVGKVGEMDSNNVELWWDDPGRQWWDDLLK